MPPRGRVRRPAEIDESTGEGTIRRISGRIRGMRPVRKAKVSVTLAPDLLDEIDRRVPGGGTRSRIIEEWLRLAAREHARRDLDAATTAYYEGRTGEQRDEDDALAGFSTRATHERDFDAKRRVRRRRV